jgi:integrase
MAGLSVLHRNSQVNANEDVSMSTNLTVMPKPKKEPRKRSRVRGQGTLFLRGRVYWMELHWKGERFRESLETEDRETALMKLDSRVAAIRSGEVPKTFEPITVQTMFDNWIAECERMCKPRTVKDYKSRWNIHLKETFGKMFATQVTKEIVAAYLQRRSKAGAGPITENRENRVLQMIFNYNKEKIPANNFPNFPDFHSEKAHVRKGRLSAADYQTVMARLEDPKLFWLKVMLALTFKYGFRRSELIGAKVGYFDPKQSTFTLPPFTTKNKMERRVTIKRDGELFQMLVKLTAGRDPGEALLARNGRPVKDFRGAWKKVTAGIENGRGGDVTMHDLRRSAITGMANKGIDAAKAGTHLTADVFSRYISRSAEEEQEISGLIES